MRAAGGRARGITWVALVGACAAPAACGWGTLAGDTTTYPDDAPAASPTMTGTPVGPPLRPDGSDDGGTGDDAVGDATVTDGADGTVGDGSFPTAAHAAWPRVPDTEGGALRSPSLVTIVASNDAPVDGTDIAPMLHAFSDAFGATDVWAAVSAEYGVGALTSVAHLTGPAIAPGTYPTAYFQSYVGAVLGGDAGPAPNGDTIYLLYVPYGVVFSGSDDPCGYHAAYPTLGTSTGDQLAVVRRCTPAPVETQLGNLTNTASHEIVESATDSLGRGFNLGVTPSTPWDASVWQSFEGFGHVELGDLCEGTRIFDALDGGPDGGWEIQRMWSNAGAADGGDPCSPPYDEPYYGVSGPDTWYAVQPGGSVAVPFTGWSTGPVPAWQLYPHLIASNDAVVTAAIADAGFGVSSEGGLSAGCGRWQMENGVAGTLTVSLPSAAVSGDYFVFTVHSFKTSPSSCVIPVTSDAYHAWPFGVYVP